MRILLILLIIIFIFIAYKVIRKIVKVKKSKDYKIAIGILNKMNYNTIINRQDKYCYTFELEGFQIKTESDSIYVDGVKLGLKPIGWPFHDPAYIIIDKIHIKAEDILTREERENEEMTKKDAFISLYNK